MPVCGKTLSINAHGFVMISSKLLMLSHYLKIFAVFLSAVVNVSDWLIIILWSRFTVVSVGLTLEVFSQSGNQSATFTHLL